MVAVASLWLSPLTPVHTLTAAAVSTHPETPLLAVKMRENAV
jgi:hypothetical protein